VNVRSIFRRVLPAVAVASVLASGFVSSASGWSSRPNYKPIVLTLVSGWRPSAERLSKALRVEWPDLALWLATGLVALLLMHSMFRWLSRGGTSWRMRSTAAVFALLGTFLLFAMSAVGIAHQTGWWMGSGEAKWRGSVEAYDEPLNLAFRAEDVVQSLLTQGDHIPATTLRSALLHQRTRMHERMFITIFEDERGVATGAVIAPRDPHERARLGYIMVNAQEERESKNLSSAVGADDFDFRPFDQTKPLERWIKAGDFSKLSSELQRLRVDPTPFLERWRFDQSSIQP
jgi:hypothetical protein